MTLSTNSRVVGFKLADAKFVQMKDIYDKCTEAGVRVPNEVDDFFYGGPPNGPGVEVDLTNHACAREWTDSEMQEGFEIEIAKLPRDIKILRFVNSY